MNLLLARFSLFLIMIVGIAGSTLVQGNPSVSRSETTVCVTEIATVGTVALSAPRESSGSATTRTVRWQSLLPGAFR